MIVVGGSIYLAVIGSYGWLIVGIPAGAWMAKRAFDAQRRQDVWLRAHPESERDDATLY